MDDAQNRVIQVVAATPTAVTRFAVRGRLAVSGNVSAVVSRIPRATISVRVQPRARSDALAALRAGVLIVRVMAPPLDGRANDAVCRLLARACGVRASDVTVLRGERTRDKVVAIDGVDQAAAEAAVRAAVNR